MVQFPRSSTRRDTSLIRTDPMRSPDDRVTPGIASTHIVDAIHTNLETQTCNDQRDDIDRVSRRAGDSDILTDAVPFTVPDVNTVRNATKMMVWAGYTHSRNVPTHLRGAPDQCLVYRRMVRDLDDNNKTLSTLRWTSQAGNHIVVV
jgi:hypothetical protein